MQISRSEDPAHLENGRMTERACAATRGCALTLTTGTMIDHRSGKERRPGIDPDGALGHRRSA